MCTKECIHYDVNKTMETKQSIENMCTKECIQNIYTKQCI